MNKTVYIVLYTLSIGGAEQHASSITNVLAQNGYKVEIVLLQNCIVDYTLDESIKVHSLADLVYPDAVKNKKTSYIKSWEEIFFSDSNINFCTF